MVILIKVESSYLPCGFKRGNSLITFWEFEDWCQSGTWNAEVQMWYNCSSTMPCVAVWIKWNSISNLWGAYTKNKQKKKKKKKEKKETCLKSELLVMIMQTIKKANSTSNSHPTVLNDTDDTKPSSKQPQLQPKKYT